MGAPEPGDGQPPWELEPAYPGTCVRLKPLGWWWLSLLFLLWSHPSPDFLRYLGRELMAPGQEPWRLALAGGQLLFYAAWKGLWALVALYPWIGRLEFRVNVERRRVEVWRGVGRLGFAMGRGFDAVEGLELVRFHERDPRGRPLDWAGLRLLAKGGALAWGFGLKARQAQQLMEMLKHRHPVFGPREGAG